MAAVVALALTVAVGFPPVASDRSEAVHHTGSGPAQGSIAVPAGSAPLGSVPYPVPVNAIYVSTYRGNDMTGTGTVSAPVHTVARAVELASSGSTIVVRGGTYHESVTVPVSKAVTIEPYPGDAVWFDGSSDVSGWSRSGSAWVHTGWTAKFDSTPGYTAVDAARTADRWTWLDPNHPMAAHPDQVWSNGIALNQVASLAQVTANTFFVDYAASKLYVGSDPTHASVRASTIASALVVQSPNSVVRGLGFRRYATPIPEVAAVRLTGLRDHIENVSFADMATTALDLSADESSAAHVTIAGCGLLGVHVDHAYDSSLTDSRVTNNNTEHFNMAPVAGGVKITSSRTVTVRNNVIANNYGHGLWFDESSYDMNVSGNSITGNLGRGMIMEISAVGIVVNNLFAGNGQEGMLIEDTSTVQVWNNSFRSNAQDLVVYQDRRTNLSSDPGHDPRRSYPDATEPWITGQITVADNVMQLGWPYLLFVADGSGRRTAAQMGVTVDGNLMAVPTASSYGEIAWAYRGNLVHRYTAAQFAAAHLGGAHNRDGHPSQAGLFSADQLAAAGSPVSLPASVAAVAGWSTGLKALGYS